MGLDKSDPERRRLLSAEPARHSRSVHHHQLHQVYQEAAKQDTSEAEGSLRQKRPCVSENPCTSGPNGSCPAMTAGICGCFSCTAKKVLGSEYFGVTLVVLLFVVSVLLAFVFLMKTLTHSSFQDLAGESPHPQPMSHGRTFGEDFSYNKRPAAERIGFADSPPGRGGGGGGDAADERGGGSRFKKSLQDSSRVCSGVGAAAEQRRGARRRRTEGEADTQQREREGAAGTSDHRTLRKFYEKLMETDEKVQRMKGISELRKRARDQLEREHKQERAASRAKRSFAFLHRPRHDRSKSEKARESNEKLEWKLSSDPKRSNKSEIIVIKSAKSSPIESMNSRLVDNFKGSRRTGTEINSPAESKHTKLENVKNTNSKVRVKRAENVNGKSPTGFLIENEKIFVEFGHPPKAGHNAKMYAKCTHVPKPLTESHEKELNHPFFKNSEHHDNILDQFIKINFEQIDLMSPAKKEKQIFKQVSETSTTAKHAAVSTPVHDSATQKKITTENSAFAPFTELSNYGNELIDETDSNFKKNKFNDNYSDVEYDNDEKKLQSEESEDLDQQKLSSDDYKRLKNNKNANLMRKRVNIQDSNSGYAKNRRLLQIDVDEDEDMNSEPYFGSEIDRNSTPEKHVRKKRNTEENVENIKNVSSLGNNFNENNRVSYKEQDPTESRNFGRDEHFHENGLKTRTKREINVQNNPFDQITSSFNEIEKTVSKFIREISNDENVELLKTKEENVQTEKPLNNESSKARSTFKSLAAISDKVTQATTEWFESIEKIEYDNNRLGKLSQDYSDYGVLDEKRNYNMYEEKKKNQQECEEHKKTQRSTDNNRTNSDTEEKQEYPSLRKYFYLKYIPENKEFDYKSLSDIIRQYFLFKTIQLQKKSPRPSSISNIDTSGGYGSLLRLESELHSDEVRDKRHPNIALMNTNSNEEDGKEYFKLEHVVKTSSEKSKIEENSAAQNDESRYKTEDLKEIKTNVKHTFKSRSLLSVVPHNSEMSVAGNSYFGNVTNSEYIDAGVDYLENSEDKVGVNSKNEIERCNKTGLSVNRKEFNNTKCCKKIYNKGSNNSCQPVIIKESALPKVKSTKINQRSIPRRRHRATWNYNINNDKYIKRHQEPYREMDIPPGQHETVYRQVNIPHKVEPVPCKPIPKEPVDKKCWLLKKWNNMKKILMKPAITIDSSSDLSSIPLRLPQPYFNVKSDEDADGEVQDMEVWSKIMSAYRTSTPRTTTDWERLEVPWDWSRMTENLQAVCDLAAQEVRASGWSDARSARDGGSRDVQDEAELEQSSELMQELVRQMGDLVDYQVQRRVCRKLPRDLQEFLLWLTDPMGKGPPPHTYIERDDSAAASRGGGGTRAPASDGAAENMTAQPADYADTIQQLQQLLHEYEELSDDEKSKMSGVRSYISAQIESLQHELPATISMEDWNPADGAERYKRNVDKTLAVSENKTLTVTGKPTRSNERDKKPKENLTKEENVKNDKEKTKEDKPNDKNKTVNKSKKKGKHFYSRRRRREGSYNPLKKSEGLEKDSVSGDPSAPHSTEERKQTTYNSLIETKDNKQKADVLVIKTA